MKKELGKSELENLIDTVIASVNDQSGIKQIVEKLFEKIMHKEREIFLRDISKEEANKGNGYYGRELICNLGRLNLQVPRDRKSKFRPSILPPPYNKFNEDFENFIINLIMNSYSPNKIRELLKSLNLPYSLEQIEELKETIYQEAQQLNNKELPENIFALYIDAFHTSVKDENTKQVKKSVIYNIIGIDMEGEKDLYGYYLLRGNEKREDWLQIFNKLIHRGLKRVMLIVSDDFPGLDKAVETLFPDIDHQLCFLHLKRNIQKNMSKEEAKKLIKTISQLHYYENFDSAVAEFENQLKEYSNKYSSFINYVLAKKEKYFTFLKYPECIRRQIYTTNCVESFNSIVRNIEKGYGGYFQSAKTAAVGIYIAYKRLKDNKWAFKLPNFSNAIYEIRQLFILKFHLSPDT